MSQPTSTTQRPRRRGDRGEGIISTAIAVLIIAALGVIAYGAFNGLFSTVNDKATTKISEIGG